MDSFRQGEINLETALERMGPLQKEFYQSTAKFASAAGGFRSAKTVTACCFEIMLGWQIPGSLHLVGRLNAPALKDTTQRTFLELVPNEWVKQWKEAENRLLMRNGSEYIFRHLEVTDAEQAAHIRSLNLTSFYVDQSEEIPEAIFNTLAGRLSRKTDPLAHFGRLTLNPAGQDWNWRKFYDEKRMGVFKNFKGFVLPTTSNAKNLPADYIQELLDMYPADWAQRFIYGSFADFSDLVFKDFSSITHCYDGRTFIPPKDWPVYVGVDIGGVDPWAFIFAALSPEGFLFVFDEIYERGILIKDLAEKYHAILENRRFEALAYDYENQQAALEMEEYGISGSNAIKAILPGIIKLGQYLHPVETERNIFNGNIGAPRLYIGMKCQNLIRELSAYKWAKDRKGEATGLPVDRDNHAIDALRYLVHTFRPEPSKIPASKKSQMENLEPHSRLYWMRVEENEEKRAQMKKSANSPFLPRKTGLDYRRLFR